MIGVINSRRELAIKLSVLDASDVPTELEAFIDTGFTGSLTLPPIVTTTLNLSLYSREQLLLADGSTKWFDVYTAFVLWHGQPELIVVHEVEGRPLIGLTLLHGSRLTADIIPGGSVQIDPIP